MAATYARKLIKYKEEITMFDLSEKLVESIRLALRPITLQPASVYAFGGCSAGCEGSCQADCTAYKANVPNR